MQTYFEPLHLALQSVGDQISYFQFAGAVTFPAMTTSLPVALEHLREVLLALPESGEAGFEGLVASCLAEISGLTIRLAKSGSQFGRDASSPAARFAVAMEAKRYSDKLRLETLAGKAVVGGHVLDGIVDVWALCATSEAGDDTVQKLTHILEDHGVTLLVLDWAMRPLPPLAVLLAGAQTATLDWFQRHRPGANMVSDMLATVASDARFGPSRDAIRAQVTASDVGLDALRESSARWLRQRLADRALSQESFGQFVTVSDPQSPAVPRSAVASSFNETIGLAGGDGSVVAVLGDEGVGKTWLVLQWWAANPDPPIMIVAAGRAAEALDPDDVTEGIAELVAAQTGRRDSSSVARWRRRIQRWAIGGQGKGLRFVLLLDGLNEHSGRPWGDLIKRLRRQLRELGGVLVVTSRPGFWRREVVDRLADLVSVRPVDVGGYSDEELAAALASRSVSVADLPQALREFIRNPRICAVAIHLLGRLSLQPEELTRERLLIEYWRWRLRERGDLVGHSAHDFDSLLRSHARSWLQNPQRPFDRNDWTDRSGAMRRADGRNLVSDLSDIEEGRFMVPAKDDQGYQFRSEALPYALALLLNNELERPLADDHARPGEVLERLLEPVRGFDLMGDVLGAAIGLACMKVQFPEDARGALIAYWLGLQNLYDRATETVAAYVPSFPDAFLDVAELPAPALGAAARTTTLEALLFEHRDHPRVHAAYTARVGRWLGMWSRQAIGGAADSNRQLERDARIWREQRQLTRSELDLMKQLTVEVAQPPAMRLDRLSALMSANRPLEPLAEGVAGWVLVQAIAYETLAGRDRLQWIHWLNRVDPAPARARLYNVFREIDETSSPPMKSATAHAFRLVGDDWLRHRADRLQAGQQLGAAQNYRETSPHDPAAAPAANFVSAARPTAELNPLQDWSSPQNQQLELTDQVREIVAEAIFATDTVTAASAADLILQADDPTLDHLVLKRLREENDDERETTRPFDVDRTLTAVVVRRRRSVARKLTPAHGDHPTFELVELRRAQFGRAFSDAEIETAVSAAELAGDSEWLDAYVEELAASEALGDQARALMIAALRPANPHSDRLLTGDYGAGMVGAAAVAARKNYIRAIWAKDWYDQAVAAVTKEDFWRFSELASNIADWRSITWRDSAAHSNMLWQFGSALNARLRTAAERRRKKREETLFGYKVPDNDLVMMLRD